MRGRSLLGCAAGLAVLIAATEMYLLAGHYDAYPKWPYFLLATVGVGLLALTGGKRPMVARVICALLYGTYYTWTAFARYPGIAKDREPTPVTILSYVAVTASMILVITVGTMAIIRIVARWRMNGA